MQQVRILIEKIGTWYVAQAIDEVGTVARVEAPRRMEAVRGAKEKAKEKLDDKELDFITEDLT